MTTGRTAQRMAQDPFRGRAWREMAQLAAEALATGFVVSLVLALAIFIAATQAQAAPLPPAATARDVALVAER